MKNDPPSSVATPDAVVEGVLRHYAERGVLRGFSRVGTERGRVTFRLRWHHDRLFDCVFDCRRRTVRFPTLLPGAARQQALVKALRVFVAERHSPERPEHRRIDVGRARVRVRRQGEDVALVLDVIGEGREGGEEGGPGGDGDDLEYGIRKLVHLVQEIFLDFLYQGPHYEYLVEAFGLDADTM